MSMDLMVFLRTGCIAGLRLGQTEEVLMDLLGEPQGVHLSDDERVRVLKFGPLQAAVQAGRVGRLAISFLDEDVNSLVDGRTGRDLRGLSIYSLLDLLDSESIGWQVEGALCFDFQFCIRTVGGALLLFDLEHRELQRAVVEKNWLLTPVVSQPP